MPQAGSPFWGLSLRFFHFRRKLAMERFEIVICVSGGVVQEVFSSEPHIDVTLVDWDCLPTDAEAVQVPGQRYIQPAIVTIWDAQPLSRLAGSDAEAAIEAAAERSLLSAD
jgi:hypothetical protein